jgi:hypothetical protein
MKQHSLRSKTTGRFVPRASLSNNIVNGRLYDYKGAIVRARKRCNNGLRYVSFHKKLNGFVPDTDLRPISVAQVRDYLEHA